MHSPCITMANRSPIRVAVRRLIAILLFAAFVLPLALPVLALGQSAEDNLPVCCRRNGAHHCAMSMAERSQLSKNAASQEPDAGERRFHAPMECCPFGATQAPSLHIASSLPTSLPVASDVFFAHPAGVAQTESRRRMARDRSRQKRGPPSQAAV